MCISTVASNLTLLVLIANSNASFTWYSLSFLISSADLRKFLPRLSRRVLAGFCITFLFSVGSSLTFVTFFDTVFFLVVTGFLLTATLLSALFSTHSSLLLALGFRLLVFSVIVTP